MAKWGGIPLSADSLNHIEDGIANVSNNIITGTIVKTVDAGVSYVNIWGKAEFKRLFGKDFGNSVVLFMNGDAQQQAWMQINGSYVTGDNIGAFIKDHVSGSARFNYVIILDSM